MASLVRESAGPPPFAFRVWRVQANEEHYVRTLSETVRGLLTHWDKKRSWYCRGEDCAHPRHRQGSVWKGYAAVEVWDGCNKVWSPVVWELTEAAEVDVRGVFARGQVWKLTREAESDSKKKPVRAKLHDQLEVSTLRPEPEVLPVLRALYHVADLVANVRNPMPDRVMVEAVPGEAPAGLNRMPVVEVGCNRTFKEMEAEMKAKGLLNGNGHVPRPK
jgi:hypothetical protein